MCSVIFGDKQINDLIVASSCRQTNWCLTDLDMTKKKKIYNNFQVNQELYNMGYE